MKNIRFLSEKFHFLVVKLSVYLNRLVFVMSRTVNIVLSTIMEDYRLLAEAVVSLTAVRLTGFPIWSVQQGNMTTSITVALENYKL